MKYNIYKFCRQFSGRLLRHLPAIALILLGLVGTPLNAQTTVTTLGGGDPNVSPKYLGYRDGNTLHQALFHTPSGLAMDNTGQWLFVADRDNSAIRMLDLTANQTWTFEVTFTNLINKPIAVAVDDYYLYVLNRGNGTNGSLITFDNWGDAVITNAVRLTNAAGMAMDSVGNFYLTVQSNKLIRIDAFDTNRTTIATITNAGTSLQGIVVKHNGLIAACDSGRNGIYLINPTNGVVTTNAGFHGKGDFTTNGNNIASSTRAKFNQPMSVAEAGDGTLIVTDFGNNRVKAVLTSGVVTNLYGVTSQFWGGTYPGWYDGAAKIPDNIAPNAQARQPFGVVMATDGSFYTTEQYYHIIRKVTGSGLPNPPPAPPAAPTIWSVTTNYGQVTLSWSASATATNYYVKRSPSSGGPYTIIASLTGTSYTDTNVVNGTTYYYVVSAVNTGGEGPNSAEVSAKPPIPPPPAPRIGWFDYEGNTQSGFYTVLHPVSLVTLNNDEFLAIDSTVDNVTTYYIAGPAPVTSSPSSTNGSSPSAYRDGLTFAQPLSIATEPDLVIKAVNVNANGQNGPVTTAEFIFQVGNPVIYGNNAAQFTLSDITSNARLYYTLDGSDPSSTNASAIDLGTVASATNAWTVSLSITSDTMFKVRAFRNNYRPSGIVSNLFTAAAFQPNTISFGKSTGEPHSRFMARPGQFFYAPVTLQLVPGFAKMYSLQFNVTVTNGLVNTNTSLRPPAVQNGAGIDFFSMLMTQVKPSEGKYFPPADGQWYLPIQSITYTNQSAASTEYTNTLFVNPANNLLGVGWLYRTGIKYLFQDQNTFDVITDFDTTKQDLIAYSIAHDTLFTKGGGTVVVGAYSFQVPTNANYGDKYFIQLGSPSATADGVGAPGASIYIAPPTDNQAVTVDTPAYIVGDAAPFHWLNAGDFGDTNLDNSDVMQVYQAAILAVDMPPTNSDLYAAMDSSGRFGNWDSVNNYYTDPGPSGNLSFGTQQAMWDGSDLSINTNAFGDGVLDINDVYVTFRRSLDPSLIWFKRYWTNGMFVAVTNANYAYNTNVPHALAAASVSAKTPGNLDYRQSTVNFSAGDAVVVANQTIQIPISAQIFGNYPLRVLGLNLTVVPLDGSPDITQPVTFAPVAGLGSPSITSSKGAANYSAAWLNSGIGGLTGNSLIGTLTVTIPTNATSLSAYAVHFDKVSGSPNGLAIFPKQAFTGLITLSSRTNSSYTDGIPDSWRLRWFGTINNFLSLSNACPTGDGINNWKKYVAGVDPNTANNFPSVNPMTPVPSGFTTAIHWPTVSGKQYVIERSTSLFPGNWTAIATNTGTGTDMEFHDNTKGSVYFYRVRILLP